MVTHDFDPTICPAKNVGAHLGHSEKLGTDILSGVVYNKNIRSRASISISRSRDLEIDDKDL